MRGTKGRLFEGCGSLFRGGSGIIICGEYRTDGKRFLCKWCLREYDEKKNKPGKKV